MAYLVVILAAFLTKPFFNTKLCRGEYGFFKTYFLYGGLGSFAIFFGILFMFGSQALENDEGTGHYAFLTTARLALLCLSVYLVGISWAVYKIKLRSNFSSIMNFYVNAILLVSILLLPTVLFRAPAMCVVYAVALFAFYKFAWGGVFISKETASD